MASDTMAGDVNQGNNFTISVVPESREGVGNLCVKLSAGGQVTMPAASETLQGACVAMCTRQVWN